MAACAHVGRSPRAAAGRRTLPGAKPGRALAKPARASGEEPQAAASGRANKRRRTLLVLPESQPQEEQADRHAGTGNRDTPAGPMHDMGLALMIPGRAEEGCAAEGAAGSMSEVVADSMEIGGCDAMDDVSSADTGQPRAQQAQHEALFKQQQHQEAQALRLMMLGKQGRAVGSAGQSAGLGQLLSGDIQWVGPATDPPTQLGLNPSQHQTYYKAFSRVCPMPFSLQRIHSQQLQLPALQAVTAVMIDCFNSSQLNKIHIIFFICDSLRYSMKNILYRVVPLTEPIEQAFVGNTVLPLLLCIVPMNATDAADGTNCLFL